MFFAAMLVGLGLVTWWSTGVVDAPREPQIAGTPVIEQKVGPMADSHNTAGTVEYSSSPAGRPTISSRYARVKMETLDRYIVRYAAKGRRAESPEARRKGVMPNLAQLQSAVAVVRTRMLYDDSPYLPQLYEHELILTAMLIGDPIEPAVLQERACFLMDAPRDCDEKGAVGCGAANRLALLTRQLCDNPEEPIPPYYGQTHDLYGPKGP